MKKYILTLLTVVLAASCSDYSYPENKEISEKNGARVDSTSSFLLDDIKFAGNEYALEWNSETKATIDEYYTFTSEAVLYNFYLSRNIYRFVFEKEGKAPLIVSINQSKDRSWVVSKSIFEREEIAMACGIDRVQDYSNYTRDLTEDEVKGFNTLLKDMDFYNLSAITTTTELKNYCLVEAHEKDKYWTVYRSLDDAELKPLVDYVSKLSRFNLDADRVIKLPEISMP